MRNILFIILTTWTDDNFMHAIYQAISASSTFQFNIYLPKWRSPLHWTCFSLSTSKTTYLTVYINFVLASVHHAQCQYMQILHVYKLFAQSFDAHLRWHPQDNFCAWINTSLNISANLPSIYSNSCIHLP